MHSGSPYTASIFMVKHQTMQPAGSKQSCASSVFLMSQSLLSCFVTSKYVCQCFRLVWWAIQSLSRTRRTMRRSWCSPILLWATMAFLAMTRTNITYHGKKAVRRPGWWGLWYCRLLLSASCCIPLQALLAYVSQPRALEKLSLAMFL
jgi:hypothetical protein